MKTVFVCVFVVAMMASVNIATASCPSLEEVINSYKVTQSCSGNLVALNRFIQGGLRMLQRQQPKVLAPTLDKVKTAIPAKPFESLKLADFIPSSTATLMASLVSESGTQLTSNDQGSQGIVGTFLLENAAFAQNKCSLTAVKSLQAKSAAVTTSACMASLKMPAVLGDMIRAAPAAFKASEEKQREVAAELDKIVRNIDDAPKKIAQKLGISSLIEEDDEMKVEPRSLSPRFISLFSKVIAKWDKSMKKDVSKWKPVVCPNAGQGEVNHFKKAMVETNGCSNPWYTYIIGVGFQAGTFYDACQIHDFGYNCGHWNSMSKKKVDDLFYDNMMQLCSKRWCWKYLDSLDRWNCFDDASAFYYGVHWFGDDHYNKGVKNDHQPGKYDWCESGSQFSCVRSMEKYKFTGHFYKYC